MAGTSTVTESAYTMVRDSVVGQLIYYLSKRKVFQPRLFGSDYQVPERYRGFPTATNSKAEEATAFSESLSPEDSNPDAFRVPDQAKVPSTGVDLEKIQAEKGYIMVDWDDEDDEENPKNWGAFKKYTITTLISFITLSSYMASAIFSSAEDQMIEFFHTTQVKLMLGLTLFVWGYGIGPILVSSMSESPMFGGRRYILLVGQFLFVILQIPTALANHVAPFAILRFLAGLATAPSLSVAPATLNDMFGFPDIAYIIVVWSIGAVCGPYMGPLIGGALSLASWRWIFWFLLIQGGFSLIMMLFLLPETSERALLMLKAKRLRQLTGQDKIKARGDLELEKISAATELKNILWLPILLCLREPVLNLVNLHLCLLYSILYLNFEAFPIVFRQTFNFSIVTLGVSYNGLMVGVVIAVCVYILHLNRNLVRPIRNGESPRPEFVFGGASLVGSIFVPIGLFIFGWSATKSAHWIGPIVGGGFLSFGTFILFQAYMAYLGQIYPTRFASAIATNTVFRSMVGGAFPLFGTIFYQHTGTSRFPVGWGSSILGFASIAMILLPVYLLFKGEEFRKRTLKKYGAAE